MKTVLRDAGIPCARHQLVAASEEALGFAAEVGFPLVAKPPAGAGAQATYRLDEPGRAASLAGGGRRRPGRPRRCSRSSWSGEEHTFDSVTVGGETVWASIADYLPPPLDVLRNPWMQWTVLLPRDIGGPEYAGIREIGPAALRALGVRDALTHMEWFRRPDGSVAISEVAARPPGAQLTSMLGYVHDVDFYRAWAELVILGRFDAAGAAVRGRARRTCGGRDAAGSRRTRRRRDTARDRPPGRRGQAAPARASPRRRATRARVRHRARPRHRRRPGRPAPHRHRDPRRAGGGAVNVVMLSPGLPAGDGLLHPRAGRGRRHGDRGRRPAAARAAGRGARGLWRTTSTSPSPTRTPCSAALHGLSRHARIDQVECLWEPYMILAARIREAPRAAGHDGRRRPCRSATRSR